MDTLNRVYGVRIDFFQGECPEILGHAPGEHVALLHHQLARCAGRASSLIIVELYVNGLSLTQRGGSK